MKLLELTIDGFGVHHDLRVEHLSPRLNLLFGPNESGKSTFCEFVRALFFGFDTGRSRMGTGRYEPLRGGRHGGRAVLEAEDGSRLVLVLRPGARKSGDRVLTREDGTFLPPAELARLVGPITRSFFEHVHAFGLDELSDLRALSAPEMDDYLFGATSRTDPRRLTKARTELDTRMRPIFAPRSGRLPALFHELAEVRRELAGAKAEAASLPRLAAERDALRGTITSGERWVEEARAENARLTRLVAAAPLALRVAEMELELARTAHAASLPDDAATRHDELRARELELSERSAASKREHDEAHARLGDAHEAWREAKRRLDRARPPASVSFAILVVVGVLVAAFPSWPLRALAGAIVMGCAAFLLLRVVGRARARLEAAAMRRADRAAEVDARRLRFDEHAEELRRHRAESVRFRASLGCGDAESFEELVRAKARHDAVARELPRARSQLFAALGPAKDATAKEIAAAPDDLDRLERDVRQRRTAIDRAREEVGAIEQTIDELRASDRIARLRLDEERLLAEALGSSRSWMEARLAKTLLDEAARRFQEHHQPPVLRAAGVMFEAITDGEFRRVLRPNDLGGGRLPLLCERRSGEHLGPEALSRGTREQLYLALRFAALQESVRGRPVLPVVMDDVLVNFDDERVRAALGVVAKLTETHQVFYLTCHRRMRDLVREVLPAAEIFDLERSPHVGSFRPSVS